MRLTCAPAAGERIAVPTAEVAPTDVTTVRASAGSTVESKTLPFGAGESVGSSVLTGSVALGATVTFGGDDVVVGGEVSVVTASVGVDVSGEVEGISVVGESGVEDGGVVEDGSVVGNSSRVVVREALCSLESEGVVVDVAVLDGGGGSTSSTGSATSTQPAPGRPDDVVVEFLQRHRSR